MNDTKMKTTRDERKVRTSCFPLAEAAYLMLFLGTEDGNPTELANEFWSEEIRALPGWWSENGAGYTYSPTDPFIERDGHGDLNVTRSQPMLFHLDHADLAGSDHEGQINDE